MAVFMEDQTIGTTGTMLITGVADPGVGEAAVVTALAVMHRSNAGVLDMGGLLGLEMEQIIGRETLMRIDR